MNSTLQVNLSKSGRRRLVFVAALIPSALWATSIVTAKVVVASLPPFTVAALRFLMAATIMWGLRLLLPGQWQRPRGGDWLWLALTGFFQASLNFAFQYAGVKYTTAANASVVVNVRPIFVALLAVFVLNEKLNRNTLAAIILGFAGVLIITSKGSLHNLSLSADHSLGDVLILLNALSGAIGVVLTKKVLRKFSPLSALLYTLSFGALGLLPFAAIELLPRGGLPSAGWLPWLLLVYHATFCTVVAHILWNNALARLEASKTAVFLYVMPIFGVILANLLLDEAITLPLVIGAVLVLAGTYQAARPQPSQKPAASWR